jgi:acyl-CoA hydrolase
MTQIVMPTHTNQRGSLFGGVIVQWIDVSAAVAAMRHAGSNVVTASIDRLDFLSPVNLGDVVLLQAQVNYAGRTSMEVGCRVEVENPITRERRYTTKAYLTFVALDEHNLPVQVPKLVLKTAEERRRFRDARDRRADRLRTRKSLPPET